MKPSILVAAAFSLAASLGPLPAAATTYHLVDLGSESRGEDLNNKGEVAGQFSERAAWFMHGAWRVKKGKTGSIALGIDDAGDMVGYTRVVDRGNYFYPLVYYPRGAEQIAIPLPDGADPQGDEDPPYPRGARISPDGTQVAGIYKNLASGVDRCFLWHPGEATSIDIGLPPSYTGCWAFDVTDSGAILGWVWTPSRSYAAFIFKDGAFRLIGRHEVFLDQFVRINKKGNAAGDNGNEAVYWDGKHVSPIPRNGAARMIKATALNDHDEIVGLGFNGSNGTLMEYADGTLIDVVPLIDNIGPEWNFYGYDGLPAQPTGINERGEISGYAWYDDGSGILDRRGYILVPN
jgi:hypothetical protein